MAVTFTDYDRNWILVGRKKLIFTRDNYPTVEPGWCGLGTR